MDIDIKKQVWIRGHDIMAEGVIKELVKLGGLNVHNYSGKDSDSIYYIDEYNYITYRVIDSAEAFCIMKVFKELKLPELSLDKNEYWAARDKDGSLYLHKRKPFKLTSTWVSNDNWAWSINTDSLKEIKWEDKEPTRVVIKYLNQKKN